MATSDVASQTASHSGSPFQTPNLEHEQSNEIGRYQLVAKSHVFFIKHKRLTSSNWPRCIGVVIYTIATRCTKLVDTANHTHTPELKMYSNHEYFFQDTGVKKPAKTAAILVGIVTRPFGQGQFSTIVLLNRNPGWFLCPKTDES